MSSHPRVTVFSLIYNNADRVLPALERIQRQTFQDFDHVLIDDGSTDASVEKIEKFLRDYERPHIWIRHEKNLGVNKTLNEVLTHAKGDYLLGVSDDFPDEDFLEVMVPRLDSAPRAAVAFSDCRVTDERGTILQERYVGGQSWLTEVREDFLLSLLRRNPIPACSALMKKSALRAIGGFDESLLYEDWDLWLRLSHQWDFIYHPDPLVTYVRYPRSLSSQIKDPAFDRSSARLLIKQYGNSRRADRQIIFHFLKYFLRASDSPSTAQALVEIWPRNLRPLIIQLLAQVAECPRLLGMLGSLRRAAGR